MTAEDYSFPCGQVKMCRTHSEFCSGIICTPDGKNYCVVGKPDGKRCAVTEQLTLLERIASALGGWKK